MKLSTNISNYLKNLFYTKEEVDAKIPSSEAVIKSLIDGMKINVGNDYNELLIDTGTLPVLDSETPYLYLPNSTLTPIKYKDNDITYEIKNNFLYVNNATSDNSSCAQIMYPKGDSNEDIILLDSVTNEEIIDTFTKYYRGSSKIKIMTPNNTGATILFNNRTYDRTNIINPAFPINLSPSTYTFKVTTPDNKTKSITVEILCTIKLQFNPKLFAGQDINFILYNSEGELASEGTQCTINLNGESYTTTCDSNGKCVFTIPNTLNGSYAMTLKNQASTEELGFNLWIIRNINLVTEDLTMSFQDGSKFTALLKNNYNNTPLAGETITFTINGTNYPRITDEEGYAKLSMNLMPGTYTIETVWGSLKNTNTITINS